MNKEFNAFIAEKYQLLKFKENGRDKDGVDCIGLLLTIYKEHFPEAIPESLGKTTDWFKKSIEESAIEFEKFCDEVKLSEAKPLDIVMFKLFNRAHIGVYCGGNMFVSAMPKVGVANQYIHRRIWKNSLEKVYRRRLDK